MLNHYATPRHTDLAEITFMRNPVIFVLIEFNVFQHHDEEIEETIAKRPTVSIRKSSILNTEEVQEEEIDVNDYEYDDEDFEDYDDDFEDDDGDEDGDGANEAKIDDFEGVDEIRKAILEENQLAGSLNSSTSSSRVRLISFFNQDLLVHLMLHHQHHHRQFATYPSVTYFRILLSACALECIMTLI